VNSRGLKGYFKLDDNTCPRENLDPSITSRMIADGKITRRQLNLIKRAEACHANSMEHFPLLVGTMVSLLYFMSSGVMARTDNFSL
jgi:hypothetical protein